MTTDAQASRRLVPIDGTKGLHRLEPSVRQLSFMRQHCERLLKLLDVVLERTYATAPCRSGGKSYVLRRGSLKNPHPSERERLIEKAIWQRFKAGKNEPLGPRFHRGLCRHIQTCQMPLQDHRRRDVKWGKVDLIGTSASGTPVVLELKREKADDTPLRMVVEGLAYAVAVRKAWNEGHLRRQWVRDVTSLCSELPAPQTLTRVPVVGIAPIEYWQSRIGQPGRRSRGMVREDAWKPFHKLCRACQTRGFPIELLSFETGPEDANGLPTISNIRRVHLPVTSDQ